MGIRTILEKLRDGIAIDATLKSYCQANYTTDQTVFLGLDRHNPPGENYMPLIVIAGVENVDIFGVKKIYKIHIGYSVFKETVTTVANKNTYEGFILAEELREKTEEAILRLRGILGKINLESGSVANNIFPQFTANTYVIIEQINSSRN